ncbi:sulfurtransferase [Octadecabacter arcticus 238]|jgi:thiosulfate/3-mercaptopyruvate sulfurtransferase|uniref:Sulfurtransferase n=1 Tax=Octadecabacter arcticus 238 TaxID=391616 RepID=M9RRS4_9RHOB|nr:sulfurtransferase [Octadecabacter arcticus]AGI72485.1 sulfurtransferase [Octadecabacter arcticus 238]
MSDWLIETEVLARNLRDDVEADRVVLDCSWYLPESGKQAIDDFRERHIPRARFVDLMEISDPSSDYVNMLPSAKQFESVVGGLGIGDTTDVIIYDAGYVSARLWWMFRTFGHDRVRILNGGLRKWIADGQNLETSEPVPATRRDFKANIIPGRVASLDEVRDAGINGNAVIVDARTAAKFDGHEGSGYPGVASGHMRGAISTPWQLFFEPAPSHRFVSREQARSIFESRGAELSGQVLTTCGSGVTASILGFMLEEIGHRDWKLYDGSWHEWGQREDTEKLVKSAP